MDIKELINGLEAVIFANGEPIRIQRLCQTFEVEPDTVRTAVNALK